MARQPCLLSLAPAVSDMLCAHSHFPARLTGGDDDLLILILGCEFTFSHQHSSGYMISL